MACDVSPVAMFWSLCAFLTIVNTGHLLLFGQCGVNCFKSVKFNWTNGQLSIVLIPYGQQSLVLTTHVVVVVTWCPKGPEGKNHPQAYTSSHKLFWMSSLSNIGLKKNNKSIKVSD